MKKWVLIISSLILASIIMAPSGCEIPCWLGGREI